MSTKSNEGSESREPGSDEIICTNCGELTKKEAEVCLECGARQKEPERQKSNNSGLPDARKDELQKIAKKNQKTVALVSLLFAPVGYFMIGKTRLAIISLLTLNYLTFGVIIGPIHTWKIIGNARDELRRHGESW